MKRSLVLVLSALALTLVAGGLAAQEPFPSPQTPMRAPGLNTAFHLPPEYSGLIAEPDGAIDYRLVVVPPDPRIDFKAVIRQFARASSAWPFPRFVPPPSPGDLLPPADPERSGRVGDGELVSQLLIDSEALK